MLACDFLTVETVFLQRIYSDSKFSHAFDDVFGTEGRRVLKLDLPCKLADSI